MEKHNSERRREIGRYAMRKRWSLPNGGLRDKICLRCSEEFRPSGGRQLFCSPRCFVSARKARVFAKQEAKLQGKVFSISCPSCNKLFTPKGNQKFCQLKCRISTSSQYVSPSYKIKSMLPSEYAFYRIMQDRGTTLEYLLQSVDGMFRLCRGCYTPDFWDKTNDIYYEVSGSSQAFYKGKAKYKEFKKRYPKHTLIIVRPNGSEISLD